MLIAFIFTVVIASLFPLGGNHPIHQQRSLSSEVEAVVDEAVETVFGVKSVKKDEPSSVEQPSFHYSVFKPQFVQYLTFTFTVGSSYFELSRGFDSWYILFCDLEHPIDNWLPAYRIKGPKPL